MFPLTNVDKFYQIEKVSELLTKLEKTNSASNREQILAELKKNDIEQEFTDIISKLEQDPDNNTEYICKFWKHIANSFSNLVQKNLINKQSSPPVCKEATD